MRRMILTITITFTMIPSCVFADVEKGLSAIQTGNFLKSATIFLDGARKGDPLSQSALGMMYQMGHGVFEDDAMAAKWYTTAGEKADPEALFQLAMFYVEGRGVKKNKALSLKWARIAAEQGHAGAQNEVGSRYYLGLGVKRDYPLALKWYHESAKTGFNYAHYNLGAMYAAGEGVPKNYVQSYARFKLATDGGHPDGRKALQWVWPKLSQKQLTEAEALTKKLEKEIAAFKKNSPTNTVQKIWYVLNRVFDGPCDRLPDLRPPLIFVGFSISQPLGRPQCYVRFPGRPNYPDFDQRSVILFEWTTLQAKGKAYIRLVKLEEELGFSNAKELLAHAKKNKLAQRTVDLQGKPKYAIDDTHEGICVQHKRNYRRGRVTGRGLICIHPDDPSILVVAEYWETRDKKPSKDRRQEILDEAQTFLDSIELTKQE